MKSLVIIMTLGLLALAALFFVSKASSNRELQTTRSQLEAKTKELETARAEVAQVKAEMQESFAKLQGQVATLAAEKNVAEEKINALSDDMRAVLQDLEAEKVSRRTLEERNIQLATALEQTSTDLDLLKKQNSELTGSYATLQTQHDKTLEQFAAMREDYVALTKERDDLIAKFNDLDALRGQIRTVKIELRKQHIEEWKRSDRVSGANGNAGFLMKGGSWQTVSPTEAAPGSKFPLVEDIHREP